MADLKSVLVAFLLLVLLAAPAVQAAEPEDDEGAEAPAAITPEAEAAAGAATEETAPVSGEPVTYLGPEARPVSGAGRRHYQTLGLYLEPEPAVLPPTVNWADLDDLPLTGIRVRDVEPGSIAADAGFRPNDIIYSWDGRQTGELFRLMDAAIMAEFESEIRISLVREIVRREGWTPTYETRHFSFTIPSQDNWTAYFPASFFPLIYEGRSNEFFEEINVLLALYNERKSKDYKFYRFNIFWQQWSYGAYFEVRIFFLPVHVVRTTIPIFL